MARSDEGKDRWTKYDHATAIAAALSYMAVQQQDSVGLAIFDNDLKRISSRAIRRGSGNSSRMSCKVPRLRKTNTGRVLDQLGGKVDPSQPDRDAQRFFRRHRIHPAGCGICVIRKHELMVFQVLDPMEIEFPFEDVTLFKGWRRPGELLTEPRALRDAYLEQLRSTRRR
jgi:hypothetical protein